MMLIPMISPSMYRFILWISTTLPPISLSNSLHFYISPIYHPLSPNLSDRSLFLRFLLRLSILSFSTSISPNSFLSCMPPIDSTFNPYSILLRLYFPYSFYNNLPMPSKFSLIDSLWFLYPPKKYFFSHLSLFFISTHHVLFHFLYFFFPHLLSFKPLFYALHFFQSFPVFPQLSFHALYALLVRILYSHI